MYGVTHVKRFWITKSPCYPVRFFSGTIKWIFPSKDSYDYTRLLKRCTNIKTLKEIHSQIITSHYVQHQFLAAKLVSRYVEYAVSNMDDARRVFDSVLQRDVFLWNVLIGGYANKGPFTEALSVFKQMQWNGICGNKYTYPLVLKGCATMGVKVMGQLIHSHLVKIGLEFDLFVGNALVTFYAKCHEIGISRKVFDEILVKDVVSWNSMIAASAQNGYWNDAIKLFHQMLQDITHCVPDRTTFVSILPACAHEAALKEGMWIHCYAVKSGMELDVALISGLIAVYGNSGRFEVSWDLFSRFQEKNIVVWNAMIRCHGMNGLSDDALELFNKMIDSGIQPDGISFISVLSACGHGGLVDKGWELFKKMSDYGVERWEGHYACMIDLLGRAGQLDEALTLFNSMPMERGKSVYGALLGVCRLHNNLQLAEEIAERLFILDPQNAGRYILLANMYGDAGKLTDAARIRITMKEKQVKKPLGSSIIEVDSIRHKFGAEDKSHPLEGKICDTLVQLEKVMEDDLVD